MSDIHDKPTSLDAALATQIHAARLRGAYSVETLAALARVDAELITALENGAQIADVGARDRIMDILGLRPDGHRYPARSVDPNLRSQG
ncbi:hypothetical protein WYO_2938 [Methylobacterium sp. GXF4]|jgi:ribosome-binding protein aMBF1 (putative translation factor)|uniref:Ribosome-binding protein aMBF1 (Putative translation factor) n=1 Tax=Methylobacterium brachiatum TaxID=269660 RepID=A0AAJ1TND2_9HYPH|nr:helix-turn-helix domain-containing protein [Methylobacterium brachiatum]EIZ84389.1 hypothetical protein WYO_2938 [Methylobacterium sp. GXF4]MCB4803156.1 helix-turn-helix domain-containing protein [Methylobacterium brachiatum]MDF2597237.1 hypothetical protein [Methylobacterium brachiatum]MDQ0543881.1 ribosome-binding protein aMBF1 (putative translation factor) [Methylobacterium brachiatum]